jgi:uncharacterized protein
MSESRIEPVALTERIELLDVLRGLAVGGILIGNMQWFSGYGMMPSVIAAKTSLADQFTHFLVHLFIEGKFYTIFSFLFGFGFALQIARSEDRGDTRASLFKRRLFWLLVIGLAHAYLLWAGDILSVYALMGFVLLLFRRKSDESLLKWACWLLAIPILTYILIYILFAVYVSPESLASFQSGQIERWNSSIIQVQQSNFIQIMTGYNLEYIVGRYAGLIIQMRLPKILAMFLLGFYAYRRGFLQNSSESQPFIRKVLIYGFILGFAGNLVFALAAKSEADIPPTPAGIVGVIAYSFGVPALAFFLIALVATLWRKASWQRWLVHLAPVGRMALTNYLLQTLVCVFLFYGYGFAQYGNFGALASTFTALVIFAFQMFLSSLWLKYFAYGPLEWIWRQLTYRQRLDLRLKPWQT